MTDPLRTYDRKDFFIREENARRRYCVLFQTEEKLLFPKFDISNVSQDIGNKSEGDLLSIIAGIFILCLIIDFSPFTCSDTYISIYIYMPNMPT